MQLVRDEDHGAAGERKLAHRLEQPVGLLRREHRGRLVENHDAGITVERLDDLDALLLADRELPDASRGVDVEAELLRERAHAPLDLGASNDEGGVVTEHDVLGHRERGDEPEVLVHHADARSDRGARRAELHRLARDLDVPAIGAIETGQHVRERALAGPVLAQQGMHLTDRGLELDRIVRDDAGEALRDRARRHCDGALDRICRVSDQLPFGLPTTFRTNQSIERISPRLARLPLATRTLPPWSTIGPANS